MGFSHSSAGKESTCNVGDPGSIPGLGRSTGEGIDYPLQYSWASHVAQLVKNSLQGGSGWGTHVHPWLIHVNVRQKSPQYCKVTSLQLKYKKDINKQNK